MNEMTDSAILDKGIKRTTHLKQEPFEFACIPKISVKRQTFFFSVRPLRYCISWSFTWLVSSSRWPSKFPPMKELLHLICHVTIKGKLLTGATPSNIL